MNDGARAVKIGDVVAWTDVPDGTMVRTMPGDHAVRLRGRGVFVGQPGEPWLEATPWPDPNKWHWPSRSSHSSCVTIVALGLTGSESADDLRRLAEVFEVYQALYEMPAGSSQAESSLERVLREGVTGPTVGDLKDSFYVTASRLHAAGWRPGMTAEDAARMLSTSG